MVKSQLEPKPWKMIGLYKLLIVLLFPDLFIPAKILKLLAMCEIYNNLSSYRVELSLVIQTLYLRLESSPTLVYIPFNPSD